MRRFRWVALGTALCFALLGSATAADEAYTAGELAVNLAKVITGRADYTAENAAELLSGMGITLNANLNAQVSEGLFVETFNQLGVNLVTANPDAKMTKSNAAQLMKVFDDFGGAAAESHVDNNSIKCKGNEGHPSFNQHCITDADCPGGFCKIPPGQAKKIGSPSGG